MMRRQFGLKNEEDGEIWTFFIGSSRAGASVAKNFLPLKVKVLICSNALILVASSWDKAKEISKFQKEEQEEERKEEAEE